MVSAVDEGVGQILDKLDELNIAENTMVVFLSDNGGPEPHNGSDNGVLRGMKGDLFEGGIRVPFAMKWPGRIPAGEVYDNPIISLDIFATIIAQSPKKVELENPIDGINLIPYLNGEINSLPHDQLFWRKFDAKDYVIRQGDEKLLIQDGSNTMLFNLTDDISEENNTAPTNKDRVDKLYSNFQNWEKQLKAPVFMGLSQDKEYSDLRPDRFDSPAK